LSDPKSGKRDYNMVDEKGLETLQVWKRALAFAVNIQQQVLPLFPVEEKWVLATQLRRAVQSIAANIAEGYGRFYYQEGVRFCYIARGSLEETFTQISLAHKLGNISPDTFNEFNGEIQELRRLLNGYISFLKKSKRGENEPGSIHGVHEDPTHYLIDPDYNKSDS
jgi:four helix bundle protein